MVRRAVVDIMAVYLPRKNPDPERSESAQRLLLVGLGCVLSEGNKEIVILEIKLSTVS